MNPLYNFGISVFGLGLKIASTRNQKVRKMLAGREQTLSRLRRDIRPGDRYVWIHAASLGEFEQGRPLIERIRRERPDLKILLSFFSPSGYEVRHNYDGADCVVYLPLDSPAKVREFLDAAHPEVAIFVKYEFWGNYLTELHRRGIPTYIISAIFRPKQIFFRPWGGMFRKLLGCFRQIYVQDENSRRLLAGIGVENVTVAGDTRFDRVTDIMRSTFDIPGMERLRRDGRLTMIFGSSWEPDEEIYIPWLRRHPEISAVIAPHEFNPQRLEALRREVSLREGDTMMLSDYERLFAPGGDPSAAENVRVVIVDCFGKLSSLYRYGDIAYIGGGFGHGIHNLNEAAVYGMPVVFGPRHQKFKEASGLIDCGGGFSIDSADAFNRVADSLTSDPAALAAAGKAAGQYIRDNLGATDRIFNSIFTTQSNTEK